MNKIERLSQVISDDEKLDEEWTKHIVNHGAGVVKFLLHSSKVERLIFRIKPLYRIIGKAFQTKKRAIAIHNMIRCQSLRTFMTDTFNKSYSEK